MPINYVYIFIFIAILAVVAIIVGFITRSSVIKSNSQKIANADKKARDIIDDAIKTAETKKKEALLEAKEENIKAKNELEKEVKERRNELQHFEQRVQHKEELLDKKTETLEKNEKALFAKEESLKQKLDEAERLLQSRTEALEKLAEMTKDEAKDFLLKAMENEIKHEKALIIKELDAKAKEEADRNAKEYIVSAIQRCAADHVSEATVSVVELPSDDMKGRIIGREGRNIRTLESITGVDLIIDDTPEAVILSAFDPIRREVARLALEKLIIDGRIHPARIEEMVEKAKKEVDLRIKEEGENAVLTLGLHGIRAELVKILGRLHYRTSFGQNVLKHSIEVANLAGLLAAETGQDIKLAKRSGLLHDIGKAMDHEIEGSHVQIGVDLCTKYKEHPVVINSVASHHGDVEPESIIACLVAAADSISAARTGARREALENYTNRLKQLEEIANGFEAVDKSFAIQAGREIRIMVIPEKISDDDMVLLAHDISGRIEDELDYPGQIKVNIIRESRVVDYAK